jgi:hypothetical protein
VFLKASGVIDKVIRISLIDADLRNSTTLGLTNLDASISTRSTFDYSSDEVTVQTNNDKTGYSITGAVTTANASDVTAIKAKTDQLAFTIANKVDSNALSGNFMTDSSSTSNFGTLQGLIGSVGTDVLALNDFDPATDAVANVTTVGSVTSAVTTSNASDVTAIKAVTDNLPDSGALTSLATASALTTVDTVVDAIKVVTDALPNSGALSDLATAANLATVDAVVDAIKVVTDSLPNGGSLSDLATAAALATTDSVADANKVILDKVDSALESDGSV